MVLVAEEKRHAHGVWHLASAHGGWHLAPCQCAWRLAPGTLLVRMESGTLLALHCYGLCCTGILSSMPWRPSSATCARWAARIKRLSVCWTSIRSKLHPILQHAKISLLRQAVSFASQRGSAAIAVVL